MNKNSKSVVHAKALLKNLNKPFSVCLLNYIEELEEKAYKSKYYEEHAYNLEQELLSLRGDNAINEFIVEKIKDIVNKESKSTFDNIRKLADIKNLLGE